MVLFFDFEAKDSGRELFLGENGSDVIIGLSSFSGYHEQKMREGSAEKCPIHIRKLLLGNVDILASGAVDLHASNLRVFADTDWDHILLLAHDSGAGSELATEVLLPHDAETLWGCDIASMDQAVELGCLLIDLQESGHKSISTVGLRFHLLRVPCCARSSPKRD